MSAKVEDTWKWWYYVGAGALSVALGAFEFYRLSDLDDGKVDSVRLRAWESAVYSLMGKWGVLAVICAVGAFLVGYGVYQFTQGQKKPQA